MRRILLSLGIVIAVAGLMTQAYATDTLDIQAELSRPGVKLVVVEFYATWCEPCMKAVPEWKALHKKYKKEGLRFIVVSADEGVCSRADWSPDETVCDADGVLQRKFEVTDLPTSLLFSWEGNIAMRSHRVKPVEEAIDSYFRNTTYKIEVDQPEVIGDKYAIGSNEAWVKDDVVARLRQRSKFDVVTVAQHRIAKQESDICSASFPPNSILRIKLTGDDTGERYLSLQLEKDGCVKASAQEAYTGKGFHEDKASLRKAVKTAVDKILAQIITVRAPEDADSGVRVQTFRNRFDDDGSGISNPMVDKQGYLAVESKPEGATVFVNGDEMGETPFVKEMMVGEYVVLVKSGALWIPAKKRVKLSQDGARLQMDLGPNYGILEVKSNPSGADIWLDGSPTGQNTPYTFPMRKAGDYSLVLKKKMYLSKTIPVQLGNGKTVEVSERLEANFGSIKVTSTPTGASIIVDGKDSGKTTPATISPVKIGGREITLRLASHNDFKKRVNVERGQTFDVAATLTGQMGMLKVEAFLGEDGKSRPVLGATVMLDGEEVGNTPFKKRMLVGTYKIQVNSEDGSFEGDGSVEEGKNTVVKAVLESGGASGIKWIYSKPAKLEFTKSEVTLGQFKKCMAAGNCKNKNRKTKSENKYCNWGYSDRDDHPMNCVDWYGAKDFCDWAGGRLPTEEEWFAEASNNKSREYPWGNQTVTCDYAIWGDGSNTDGCGKNSTWPVCSKPAGNSVSGLCDMSGNVWEWTSSSEGSARVLRGGSWNLNNPDYLRAASRNGDDPSYRNSYYGFRCVRSSH